jgi:TP53 regulating kinase and related kinases
MAPPPVKYVHPPLPPPFNHTSTEPTTSESAAITNQKPILLAQGAEAHLYKTHFLNPSIPAALKIRPTKKYRHPVLDRRLTKQRILQEARCLHRLVREGGLRVPAVYALDWDGSRNPKSDESVTQHDNAGGEAWLLMEWIEGPAVRRVLEHWEKWMKVVEGSPLSISEGREAENRESREAVIQAEEEKVKDLLRRIGQAVGSMHRAGVIHGDLTTSNLILTPPSLSSPSLAQSDHDAAENVAAAIAEQSNNIPQSSPLLEGEIVLIDFGLAYQAVHEEDRAVDLYVLEKAVGSTHPRTEGFFDQLLQGYKSTFKDWKLVMKRLEDVRMRGRKRSMIG